MRKTRIIFIVLILLLLLSCLSLNAFASSTVTIYEHLYVGEYTHPTFSGIANIIFGQVPQESESFGIIIESSNGEKKSFAALSKGEEGKFGIAIYQLPDGVYTATAYVGDLSSNYTLSDEITFTANQITQENVHDFKLSQDNTQYVCDDCGLSFASGLTTLTNTETEWNGDGYTSEYLETLDTTPNNYLFIGSSIANGYHTATDTNRVSMANMLREDYLTVSYSLYRNGQVEKNDNVYMRKISSPINDDQIFGTYRWSSDTITLNSDNTGSINGIEFEYYLNGNYFSLASPVGTLYSLEGLKRGGDKVYKYTSDGNSISAYATSLDPAHPYRYTAGGEAINMYVGPSIGYEGSQTYYERSYVSQLLDALHDIGDQNIDKVFIQLSTNDIGQFTSSAATEHLPFGSVLADNVTNSSAFDVSTSFGAMEYIIARCKEQWEGVEIVIFSCWMMDSDWALYQSSGKTWDDFVSYYSNQDNYELLSEYAKMRLGLMKIVDKWNTGYIDAWADYDANKLLNENRGTYKSDTVHLHEAGYEKVAFPDFRAFIDGKYKKWEDE